MKILYANIPTPNNRFMVDLKKGLEEHADVTWDCDEFWKCEKEFDIVHIHWPEYLSFEVESYLRSGNPFPKDLMQRLIRSLEHWKKNATIVYNRHNHYPHARQDEAFKELYRIVISYCSTVFHFANYSIQQFKAFYPDASHIQHVVIPHQNYSSLPNTSTRQEARAQLKIDDNAKVMLVFGGINENEKAIIEKAYSYIPGNNKVLLAPGWKINRRKISYIRLREWVWKWDKWKAGLNKKRRVNLGFIQEDEAHLYLNASDFLFIPRTTELNSGNITLGCTFGLVVVGKAHANIGEILAQTGNPTFEVGNDESLKAAIHSAYQLISLNHGEVNRKIALDQWNVPTIAKQYIDAMKAAINSVVQ